MNKPIESQYHKFLSEQQEIIQNSKREEEKLIRSGFKMASIDKYVGVYVKGPVQI